MLHIALNGTAEHVERTVRGFRRMQRENERNEAEAIHERRYLDCRRESDGSVRLEARLAPEVGEMLLKALEAAQAQLEERRGDAENAGATEPARLAPGDVSAETSRTQSALPSRWDAAPESVSAETPPRSASQRRADALEHILKQFLAGKCSGSAAQARTSWWCTSPTMRCVTCRRARARRLNTAVRWRWRRRGGWVATGPCWEWSRARRASRWRSGAGPGRYRRPSVARCAFATAAAASRAAIVPAIVQAHHIRHWADGGETALGNLVTLCSFHHRQVHEGGYGVRVRQGAIEFTRPDGRVIPPAGRTHSGCFRGNTSAADGAQRLAAFNAARGLAINAHTARCGWGGERMDYNIAIDALCQEAGHT